MERTIGQQIDIPIYPPGYVNKILNSLGIPHNPESDGQINLRCVFHRDSSPSMTVSAQSGKYYCFVSACGAVGDLIDLVKRYKSLNDFEALRFMARNKPDDAEAFQATLSGCERACQSVPLSTWPVEELI